MRAYNTDTTNKEMNEERRRKNFMENNVFSYQYSAQKNKEVENIRNKYLPREKSDLETLRELDRRVQSAGMIESLTVGIIGCLIFGVGMCFGLGALVGESWIAALLGIVGVVVMIPAYPIYKHISKKTKEKLAPEILSLSEKIIKS